jgi:hypothetical protein
LAARPHLLMFCRSNELVDQLRKACPGAMILPRWERFVEEYSRANVCVVVLSEVPPDLPLETASLRRQHPFQSFVVVTHLDAGHMLPFRRVCVDEFFDIGAIGPLLGTQMDRAFIATLRDRLRQFFERGVQKSDAVRQSFAAALAEPPAFRSVRALSRRVGVTTRTLEKQWNRGFANSLRLEDALWIIRLLYALELRQEGARLSDIAERLRIDVRSLQNASRRHLMSTLGSLCSDSLAVQAADLALCLLSTCGNSSFPKPNSAIRPNQHLLSDTNLSYTR